MSLFRQQYPGKDPGRSKPPSIPDPTSNRRSFQLPKPATSKIYALVVCGATGARDPTDPAMFGDFLGIASTLRMFPEDCLGTYLSCFPLEDYFTRSGHQDIKFGKNEHGEPLFVYTRHQWATRSENFFTDVSKDRIASLAIGWIQTIAKKVQAGDCIDIFFQCHGTAKGWLVLGDSYLTPDTLGDLLDAIPAGVQVNCVGSHCHSGLMVDEFEARNTKHRYAISACGPAERAWVASHSVSNRCRNMAFSQPFIQSLARCKIPNVAQEAVVPPTIEQHHDFLKRALQHFVSMDNERSQHPQHFLSSDQELALTYMEELIFRDYADVLHDARWSHRRRRLEFPTKSLPTLKQMRESDDMFGKSEAVQRETTNVIQAAASACIYPDSPYFSDYWDEGLLAKVQGREDYGQVLNNLYWRGRQQSAVFDAFIMLVEREFISWNSMEHELDVDHRSIDIVKVYSILSCFSFISETTHPGFEPFQGYQLTEYPFLWLSVMIVRNCAEPHQLFSCLEFSGIFGKMDYEQLAEAMKRPARTGDRALFSCNPKAGRPAKGEKPLRSFGSWLPHGLGPKYDTWPDQIVDTFFRRWERIEKAYKNFYGLTDEQLVDEARQATYLWSHPHLEPRRKHSGSWNVPGPTSRHRAA